MTFTLESVARRVGVGMRQLRYVVYHRLVPEAEGRRQRQLRGQPRLYSAREAFRLAAAALLFQSGIKPQVIKDLFQCVSSAAWPPPGLGRQRATGPRPGKATSVLDALFEQAVGPRGLRIGNGSFVQIVAGARQSRWFEPHHCMPLAEKFRPRVTVSVELHEIAKEFARRKTSAKDSAGRKPRETIDGATPFGPLSG